jgi:hydrogenase maturation protease
MLKMGCEILADGALKLHLELENASTLVSGDEARRDEALPRSFVSAHVLLGINNGEFVSLLDPVEKYRESAATCHNIGVFPVLAGEEPDRTMMLCSPIILYDYPKIASESEGDFFDGTEMDEMLTLRVLTLTDAEKQQMRNGDPRARRILERTESLTADSMLKAHGVIRGMREIREDAQ